MSKVRRLLAVALATFYAGLGAPVAAAYSFNELVPDVRQPVSLSGGSACPVRSHQLTTAGAIPLRWSTVLGANPSTIVTTDATATGRLNEIEQVVAQSLQVWSSVGGTTLTTGSFVGLSRTPTQNACGVDGVNSICFDQADAAFTPGVLAFTRVVTADRIGAQIGSATAATEVGQILDADIYFNPNESRTTFATPSALPNAATAYDLESLLTHEVGHLLGFSHSAVWRAMMFPFAAGPGTFAGQRPSEGQLDAPLAEDDRTGLRALYPDATDTMHRGSIRGRVLAANPLSLPMAPPGVTGVFGAHVVAVDAGSGDVIGATIGGWSCSGAGPVQFDGSYLIERLAIGHDYQVYAEAMNGLVSPAQVSNA